jgi:hypothetical protein
VELKNMKNIELDLSQISSVLRTNSRKSSFLVACGLIASLCLGCQGSPSAYLAAPPVQLHVDKSQGQSPKFELKSKVDIVFLIDNSESMLNEQDRLIAGIDKFVDSFGENAFIDYRVGVLTVYDSHFEQSLCNTPVRLKNGSIDESGKVVECYPEGKLRSPFITRSEGAKETLRNALRVGTLKTSEGGPEIEEMFSPILKGLSPEMNKINGDFIRPDSQLVIVIVSDEEDSSYHVGVDSFITEIDRLVGLNRTDLYAVVAIKPCHIESYAHRPDKILQAINRVHGTTEGRVFPICDENFGNHLASIGSDIRKKFKKLQIVLPSIPQEGTLILYYGDSRVAPGPGWNYNPKTLTVTINEKLKIPYVPNAEFWVDYIKVDENSIRRNRAKAIL